MHIVDDERGNRRFDPAESCTKFSYSPFTTVRRPIRRNPPRGSAAIASVLATVTPSDVASATTRLWRLAEAIASFAPSRVTLLVLAVARSLVNRARSAGNCCAAAASR